MHLRRINNPKDRSKKLITTLSCNDGFYYPVQPTAPDLESAETVEQKQDKQQAA